MSTDADSSAGEEGLFPGAVRLLSNGVTIFIEPDEVLRPDYNSQELARRDEDGRSWGEVLASLRMDIQRLIEGWMPSEADLASAPILDNWGVVEVEPGEVLCRLCGSVSGLDGVQDGDQIGTTQILAVDEVRLGWARDRLRFYRLGRPYGWPID
jgi:hypothetical protein